MISWLEMIEASDLTAFLRSSVFAVPALEVLHLIGLAMFVGGAMSIDLRLLGRHDMDELTALFRRALPWTQAGFGLLLASGILLFLESPIELYVNSAFRIKLVLIALGGLNALVFHRLVYPHVASFQRRWSSISALVSLCVWMTVIVFGRLITYV